MPNLSDLGKRICVIGPSNSGKSTLAERLAAKIDASAVHLDQLAHMPGTNWKRRPDEDFVVDHDRAIAEKAWVIDGNYSVCMPQRFARATSVIWLDLPLGGFLYRYILRSIRGASNRPGHLQGARGEFNWGLIKYTFFNYPKNRKKYDILLSKIDAPVIRIKSMKDLNHFYTDWGLSAP